MAKIIIDTNEWFDLINPKFSEVLDELSEKIEIGELELLINEIIVNEWNRNKERVLKQTTDVIKSYAKNARQMSKLLGKSDSDLLTGLIDKYMSKEEEQIKLLENQIEIIEGMMKEAMHVPITEDMKIFVVNRALTNFAPFHNKKNNVADALIFFSAIEFVNNNYKIATDLYFISQNYKEFCDINDKTKLHPDLIDDTKITIYFNNNLAGALKMKSGIVEELTEYHEYQWRSWIEGEVDIARGK